MAHLQLLKAKDLNAQLEQLQLLATDTNDRQHIYTQGVLDAYNGIITRSLPQLTLRKMQKVLDACRSLVQLNYVPTADTLAYVELDFQQKQEVGGE